MPQNERVTLRGIDSPEHLCDYFIAKKHPFLVFKVADILDMPEEDQRTFLQIINRSKVAMRQPDCPAPEIRSQIQGLGLQGYVRIPVVTIRRLFSMDDLAVLQGFCFLYRDIRQGKFSPSRWEICKCHGRNPDCIYCDGGGRIQVLLEMSQLETALAEGKGWDQIEKEGLAYAE